MKKILSALAVAGLTLGASAKLPAPDATTKAKAAEAAAKTAWQAKVDAYQLCKAQDKIAARYGKHAGKEAASAAPGAATPVASSVPPPCADPGPFAYDPPEQKPLETSGAHSPAGTAVNPPSVKSNSAEMATKK